MCNGKGRLIFPNGDIYEGNWKNNMMDGNGIYEFHDSRFAGYYAGEWK